MFDDCIIMAGGSGTRLWPASNSRLPKQFLTGPGGRSFFQAALERGLAVTSSPGGGGKGRVIIITGKAHVPLALRDCQCFSAAEKARVILIPEPVARNTAPAIACGAVFARLTAGANRNILVLTSDHVIGPLAAFLSDAEKAARSSAAGSLAVFGIPPGRPDTGYGYIEAETSGGALSTGSGALSTGSGVAPVADPGVYRAASFREKPDRETAEKFLAAGNFYWNSGMFAFNSDFIIEEFQRSEPDALTPFKALGSPARESYAVREGVRILENWSGLEAAYRAAKAVSIDYAVAEKCRKVMMVASSFDWFDVGSWDEYAKLRSNAVDISKNDSNAVGATAEVFIAPGKDNTASSCFVDADIPVALCGVEDLIVVIRSGKDGGPATALVARKGETQRVKDIVEQIKAAGRTDLL
jgi:mannose-1-phosphate guanylyltransferase/mannose-1-phosphate guanylyltransferase/mannose-6-phosphate isomerase